MGRSIERGLLLIIEGAAWSDDGPGQDDVDFNPRAPAGVDMPSAMESEPYSLQANVTQDVRADGPNNQPVDCFTRFKRVVRGDFHIHLCMLCYL